MKTILQNEIYSIGVDIGTSTTEIIISKLKMKHILSSSLIKETVIEEKEILYKSAIKFTPLIDEATIDFSGVKNIISKAIKESNISKEKISTGAVIITGETARKENAEEVSKNLSEYLGDFVVATAGPKLESLLAGYGAGVFEVSKKYSKKIINLDIGGGTTNVSVFDCGKAKETFALDIGGRLIRFNGSREIIYISERIKFMLEKLNLDFKIGDRPDIRKLEIICMELSKCLFEVCSLEKLSDSTKKLFISDGFKEERADFINFSGGVAEYIDFNLEDNIDIEDIYKHNDIGIILGKCIVRKFKNHKKIILSSQEKIRATVIGAGNHSLKISGSTIAFKEDILPIKNIPIIKPFENNEDIKNLYNILIKKAELYNDTNLAIALKGSKSPTYEEIQLMSSEIIRFFKEIDSEIIVILENDFGKALGQVINLNLCEKRNVICIDKISTNNGDYIDIGTPIGEAIPVVIKTLIYNS